MIVAKVLLGQPILVHGVALSQIQDSLLAILQDISASSSSHLEGAEWPCSLVYLLFSKLRFSQGVFHALLTSVAETLHAISQKDTNSNTPAVEHDANNHNRFEPDSSVYFSSTVQVSLIWV